MKKETRILTETRKNEDDILIVEGHETFYMTRENWLKEREERAELEEMERVVNNYLKNRGVK